MSKAPDRSSNAGAPRGRVPRWVGPVGLAVWVVGFDVVARIPFMGLAVAGVLAWSTWHWFRFVEAKGWVLLADGIIVALAGFLAWPVVARRLASVYGAQVPLRLSSSLVSEVLAVGVGLVFLVWAARQWGQAAAGVSGSVVAWGLVVAGVAVVGFVSRPWAPGVGLVVLLSLVATFAVVAGQAWLAEKEPVEGVGVLGSAPAGVVVGAQVLDGTVSYLASQDPFNVLAVSFQEEVAPSAFLLETIGPGFVVVKGLIAVAFVWALDADAGGLEVSPATRLGAYLLVALIGLGPALFSLMQVLA